MREAAETLLNLYESRAIDRRRFLEGLAAVAAAAAPASAAAAPPGVIKIAGVNHFEIKSVDFKKTRDFYQQLFGLEAETRADRAVVSAPGVTDISIGAVQPAQASKITDHFCFSIAGMDQNDPQATVKKLQAAGYTVIPSASGAWTQPHVIDPDGRRIQLSDPRGKP